MSSLFGGCFEKGDSIEVEWATINGRKGNVQSTISIPKVTTLVLLYNVTGFPWRGQPPASY